MVDDRDRKRGRRDDRHRERPRRRPRYDDDYYDDDDDRFDDDDDDGDDYDDRESRRPRRRRPAAAPPRRRPARRPRRRAAPPKPGLFARLFGRGAPPARRGGGGLDFGSLDDEYDDYDDEPRESRRRPSRRGRPREESPRRPRRSKGKPRTLLELCTPVFGYGAVLPQAEGDPQPDYLSFRQEVVAALQRLETDAKEEGIEVADAQDCAYALALFLDEQVFGSQWSAREQWAREPLSVVLNQDPEGGVNFFRRLDGLREQQQEVKEVYLLCMAMGFRGRYGTEDVRVQTKKIGELKMRLMKEIQEVSMDSAERLFPEAYQEAIAIDDEVEPAPRWWMWASLGVVLVAFLLWVVLFHFAGKIVLEPTRSIGELDRNGIPAESGPVEGE